MNKLIVVLFLLSTLNIQVNAFQTDSISEKQEKTESDDESPEEKAPKDWFNLDLQEDQFRGVSTEKAYKELLKGKKSESVIVAILDSGIDIEHEDLKDIVWVNEDEIPDNGIDDDKNGYIDDVNGWNFIGGEDGENVDEDTYELTRLYVKYQKKFGHLDKDDVPREDRKAYKKFLEYQEEYEKELLEAQQKLQTYAGIYEMYKSSEQALREHLELDSITKEDILDFETDNEDLLRAKKIMLNSFLYDFSDEFFDELLEYFGDKVEYGYNQEFDPRTIVGDNFNDGAESNYGNNDVTGPDPMHGTHVAGIVSANRTNNIGIKGIADNVRIMSVRTVPNGDERDKDVANAIRYAVDNGAQIINMSFGKSYSPRKELVDKAVKYAESKGVLLIHAAGNDSENIDKENNFPNRDFRDSRNDAENWIEVGASSWGDNDDFVGVFSNYGRRSVDVFAPGVDIYSTMPGQEYDKKSGTSMAAPVVTGIAALIMSYYPDLTAEQVKEIILESGIEYKREKVNLPTEAGQKPKMIKFRRLSSTGSIVNAYEALKMAESYPESVKKGFFLFN